MRPPAHPMRCRQGPPVLPRTGRAARIGPPLPTPRWARRVRAARERPIRRQVPRDRTVPRRGPVQGSRPAPLPRERAVQPPLRAVPRWEPARLVEGAEPQRREDPRPVQGPPPEAREAGLPEAGRREAGRLEAAPTVRPTPAGRSFLLRARAPQCPARRHPSRACSPRPVFASRSRPMPAREQPNPTSPARPAGRGRPAGPSSGWRMAPALEAEPPRSTRSSPVGPASRAEPRSARRGPRARGPRCPRWSGPPRLEQAPPAAPRSCSTSPSRDCAGPANRGRPRTAPRRPGLFLRTRSASGGGPPYWRIQVPFSAGSMPSSFVSSASFDQAWGTVPSMTSLPEPTPATLMSASRLCRPEASCSPVTT